MGKKAEGQNYRSYFLEMKFDCDVCSLWARDFHETLGGRFPPSKHSPNCPHYKLEEFIKVSLKVEMTGFICEKWELESAIHQDCDKEEYEVNKIYLTRDQYENLNEFQGF